MLFNNTSCHRHVALLFEYPLKATTENQEIFSAVAGAVKHFDYKILFLMVCVLSEILVWEPGGTISGILIPGRFFFLVSLGKLVQLTVGTE